MTKKSVSKNHHQDEALPRVSRRRFLEMVGAAAAGLLVSRCAPDDPVRPSEPVPTDVAPATATPATVAPATATQAPVAVAETTATSTPSSSAVSQVAIGQATNYDRELIRTTLRDMLDDLGGLDDVVGSGDRVVIKTNLTGGIANKGPAGMAAIDTFVTHPEVVRALVELVRDAGAREIFVVEAVYEWGSYVEWGYEEAMKDLDVTLVDLNATEPYNDYVQVAVPGGSEIYSEYTFNPILAETDAFMSVGKMKCHNSAGVTHALKNLIGLVPARFYQLSAQHNHRSEFHGPTEESAGFRLPRIIVELNKARPINLALIDGILTTEGGEGPWIRGVAPIAPGVLIAGKDPVATDAVATAAQGFDPTASAMTAPFVRSENYLQLAADHGLGTYRLDEIEVMGAGIDEVKIDFKPSF